MDKQATVEIDHLIHAFFAVFDNRNGVTPDFSVLGQLFMKTAMIYKRTGDSVEAMNLDQFITPRSAMLTNGTLTNFYEWELAHKTVVNGGVATRMSRYGKSGLLNGEQYQGAGKKHIQLVHDSNNWKITSVVWEDDA